MIQPVKFDKFFKDIWEKRPFHIKRENTQPQYYKHLFSTKAFDEIIRSQVSFFIGNILRPDSLHLPLMDGLSIVF